MEMSTGVSLLRPAQSLLTGRTILLSRLFLKKIEHGLYRVMRLILVNILLSWKGQELACEHPMLSKIWKNIHIMTLSE